MKVINFIIGLFIGGTVGAFIVSALILAKKGDK